ncbi:MAG TPA: hypothetical protein VFV87_11910 [Pirellulaceae bacterium]|nr:hypothetical protein [Pirellulaceae bacterium]
MKGFSTAIGIILAAIFLAILVVSSVPRSEQRTLPVQITHYLVTGSLVAVLWAICFRRQVEKLRFSLLSLFVLAAMEAVLFAAIRLLNPF